MKSCSSYVDCLSLIFIAISDIVLGCDPDTGQGGLTRCILRAPNYTKYQCVLCLADACIIEKSTGLHRCRDRSATYCYYPCMREKYGLERGTVYDDCLLDATKQLPQAPIILPSACYSPAGMDCNWYRQCLAKMFNCTGPADYAISYGEKFCHLYEQSKSQLSDKAVQWLDAARKCLQVALVPVLHLCQLQPTCEDIRTKAFNSHVPCYVAPYDGFSVCSLSVSDWVTIFMTIKGSFLSSAWLETAWASVLTAGTCVGIFD